LKNEVKEALINEAVLTVPIFGLFRTYRDATLAGVK